MEQSKKLLHHRRSFRLKGFDYTSENGYFITLVTHNRQKLFGENQNGEMILGEYGRVAVEEWFKTKELRPYVELVEDEFVVMPNHIHGIIWITGNDGRGTARRAPTLERFGSPTAGSLPTIVRAYKSAVTKRINILRGTPGESVFQRNYYEHIIGTEREYERIAEYIANNPLNWSRDEERID